MSEHDLIQCNRCYQWIDHAVKVVVADAHDNPPISEEVWCLLCVREAE